MSGVVIPVAAAVALLALAAGYLLVRRRKNRQRISPAPDGAVRMDVPDEEFWRWKPRRADDRQVAAPRRRILRRRVPSSS